MTERDLREASSAIDVFGEPLVSKAYSKTYSFREDALLEVYRTMNELPVDTPKDDAKAMMKAAVLLLNRAIKEQVYAVFKAALNVLKMILTEFVPKHKIPKQDTASAVDKTLPNLLQKSGDTAARNRDTAKLFVIEESNFPEVKPLHVVPVECVKPFKLTMAPRLALSRTEILDLLFKQLGLETGGLTEENVMAFCTNAIQHNSGEVREKAEKIIISLYKQIGAPVKGYLPPDDEKTRKNVLYKKLFETFDKIDGKPSKDDVKKTKRDAEVAKQKEIEALQAQLAQLKEMTAGKQPGDGKANKDDPKNKQKDAKKGNKGKESEDLNATIDKTCIFCGEQNEAFTEEGLDLHYWKSCPMLKRCTNCNQVVEISGLVEHLLTECDAKADFVKCPRCTEAIPKSEYAQHSKEKLCSPADPTKNHCPLCHQNIVSGEDGFKIHLMGKDGCKQNPRRLGALNKGKQAAKAGGPKGKAGASKTPRR